MGELFHFSQYGCSYEDWKKGAVPIHIKTLYCPYAAFNNGIGNEPIERCKRQVFLGSRISDCPVHDDKLRCWDLYENREKILSEKSNSDVD